MVRPPFEARMPALIIAVSPGATGTQSSMKMIPASRR